jgi:hypothetical protein
VPAHAELPEIPEAGMATGAEAGVPQTWQKAVPAARGLPHFEQNMDTPGIVNDRDEDFAGMVTQRGCDVK